jgi:hypothetical protein
MIAVITQGLILITQLLNLVFHLLVLFVVLLKAAHKSTQVQYYSKRAKSLSSTQCQAAAA